MYTSTFTNEHTYTHMSLPKHVLPRAHIDIHINE